MRKVDTRPHPIHLELLPPPPEKHRGEHNQFIGNKKKRETTDSDWSEREMKMLERGK
jgi:hypothetical protein